MPTIVVTAGDDDSIFRVVEPRVVVHGDILTYSARAVGRADDITSFPVSYVQDLVLVEITDEQLAVLDEIIKLVHAARGE